MIRRALLATVVGVPLLALATILTVVFRAEVLAPATPRPGGIYTEGMVGQVVLVNPLLAGQDANARDLDALLFEPLVRVGPNGAVTGLLASHWEVSPDQRTYTFTLRPSARWSDGSPVTADDVVFTVRTVQDPQFPGTLLNASWKGIIATSLDTQLVRFSLPGRNAGFNATLELLNIIPAHLLAGRSIQDIATAAPASQVVGTGPFRLVQHLPDRVMLERNPYSWRRPWFDQLVVRTFANESAALDALDRGQVDGLAGLSPSAILRERRSTQVALYQTQTYQYTAVLFNLKPEVAYFQDRRTRQAIAMSIDSAAIIHDLLGDQAQPADSPIPRAISWAYDAGARLPGYDPTGAAQLLDNAGWPVGSDGTRVRNGLSLSVELVTSTLPPYQAVAQKVADDLGLVGIRVDVRAVATPDLIHDFLNPRTFQLALIALDNGPDPDVYPFWHSSQAHPGGFNFVSLKQRAAFLDKYLEDGRSSLDLATRAKAYANFQEVFAEEVPSVYLYSPMYSFAVSRRIHGVRVDPAIEPDERFAHVSDWYIEVGR